MFDCHSSRFVTSLYCLGPRSRRNRTYQRRWFVVLARVVARVELYDSSGRWKSGVHPLQDEAFVHDAENVFGPEKQHKNMCSLRQRIADMINPEATIHPSNQPQSGMYIISSRLLFPAVPGPSAHNFRPCLLIHLFGLSLALRRFPEQNHRCVPPNSLVFRFIIILVVTVTLMVS